MGKKQTHSQRTSALSNGNHQGFSLERSVCVEDNLLPDSAELARLKELDPNIIEWLKERATIEQKSRIDFNAGRLLLAEGSNRKIFVTDISVIISVTIIILAGMALSAFLIYNKLPVIGSIFGGATILISANSLLNFRKKREAKK